MDPPDAADDAASAAAATTASKAGPGKKSSSKWARSTEPSITDLYVIGRDIQNRSGHWVGAELTEDERYCQFFGCGAEVALIVWNLLIKFSLLPDEAELAHFLWALFFMMLYPKEKVACGLAGGSGGAIDPKILRKYIWPMIKAISNLEPHVVCICVFWFNLFVCWQI